MTVSKRALEKRKGLSRYMRHGCPMTKSNTKWCYGMCKPVNGRGYCGRIAPHGLEGRTQRAIRLHKENKKLSEKCCQC